MSDENKEKGSSSYSISDVSKSAKSSDLLVTITQDGKAVGEVIIRTTTTATQSK